MKEVLKNTFVLLKHDKKNRNMLVMSVICSLIIMISITLYISFQKYIKNNYENNIGFRTLDVVNASGEEDIEQMVPNETKLKNIKHVVDVYSSKYHSFTGNSNFKNSKYNGIITLTSYIEGINLPLTHGENIDNRKNVAICPENFYPDSSINQEIKLNINKDAFISSKELLNKNFEFYYYTYSEANEQYRPEINGKNTVKFKIVGLYNSTLNFDSPNQCYVSMDNVKDIVNVSNPNVISSSYVVVDSINSINNVINEINDLGYIATVTNYFDYEFVNTFKMICTVITTVFIFLAVTLQTLYINKKIILEYRNIGIQRAFGYSVSEIRKRLLLEILILLLIPFVTSAFIFMLLYLLGTNILFKSIELYGIKIMVELFAFAFTFTGIIVLPYIVAIFQVLFRTNKNIISYLKAEE